MKDGILQQVDTPQYLYDHPNNIFVAGFMGSPSMNFFDATLVEADGKMYVDGGTFRLEVPGKHLDLTRKYKGNQVVFGTRPEDIQLREFAPPGIARAYMQSSVDVTELMGNEIFAYLLTGKKSFVARLDPRSRAHVGETIDLTVNMDNMHLFDPKTEQRLI
jgi:multiple sugar transport system ATP-binding protein